MKKILLFGLLFCSVAVMSQPIIPHRGKIMQVYGGDTLLITFGATGVDLHTNLGGITVNGSPTSETILVTEVNSTVINGADSMILLPAQPVGTDMLVIDRFIVKYNFGSSAYSFSGTDTIGIYSYFNGVRNRLAYILDEFITATDNRKAHINPDLNIDDGSPVWVKFPAGFSQGNGSVLKFIVYYIRDEN